MGGCEPESVLLFMAAFAGRVGQVPGLVGQVFFEVLDSGEIDVFLPGVDEGIDLRIRQVVGFQRDPGETIQVLATQRLQLFFLLGIGLVKFDQVAELVIARSRIESLSVFEQLHVHDAQAGSLSIAPEEERIVFFFQPFALLLEPGLVASLLDVGINDHLETFELLDQAEVRIFLEMGESYDDVGFWPQGFVGSCRSSEGIKDPAARGAFFEDRFGDGLEGQW